MGAPRGRVGLRGRHHPWPRTADWSIEPPASLRRALSMLLNAWSIMVSSALPSGSPHTGAAHGAEDNQPPHPRLGG
jgi:hypothetical protein